MPNRSDDIKKRLQERLGPDCSVEQEKSLVFFPSLTKLFKNHTGRYPEDPTRIKDKGERRIHLNICHEFWEHVLNNSKVISLNEEVVVPRRMKETLLGKTNMTVDDVSKKNNLINMMATSAISKIEELVKCC